MEERFWIWLRRQEKPVGLKEASARFRVRRKTASNTLRRLVWKGSAIRTGNTHNVVYMATKIRPFDMRGTALNTQHVLMKHAGNTDNFKKKP